MKTSDPIAVRAAIPPLASAIKVGGQEDEPVRLTIDIYPEEIDLVQRLMHLRGTELFITLQPSS